AGELTKRLQPATAGHAPALPMRHGGLSERLSSEGRQLTGELRLRYPPVHPPGLNVHDGPPAGLRFRRPSALCAACRPDTMSPPTSGHRPVGKRPPCRSVRVRGPCPDAY